MRNIILLLCFYFIEFLLELINHFTCSIELCYGKYLKYIHFMKNFVLHTTFKYLRITSGNENL